jgi:hypothetical protein
MTLRGRPGIAALAAAGRRAGPRPGARRAARQPPGADPDERVRTVAGLGRLRPGRHTLVLRVVDHQGAGGPWRPAFLTTGPADARSRLLH